MGDNLSVSTSTVRSASSLSRLTHAGRILRKPRRCLCALLACTLSASVLASPQAPSSSAKAPTHHWYQIGSATWYGEAFQGKRTSSGERFNMNALTCAHPTLPLGSWLRVTNLRNHRFTFVRVNDRGPYNGNTIVDLSFAAAQRLHLLGKASVKVEQVRADDPELTHTLNDGFAPNGLPLGQAN